MSEQDNIPTITIKGEGREALWLVLRGSAEQMRQQLLDIFEFPESECEGLALIELALNADTTLKAMSTASDIFKAKVVPQVQHPEPVSVEAEGKGVDPWAAVEAEEKKEEGSPVSHYEHVRVNIADADTVDELQQVWYAEKTGGYEGHVPGAFNDREVVEAYKARGAELKNK